MKSVVSEKHAHAEGDDLSELGEALRSSTERNGIRSISLEERASLERLAASQTLAHAPRLKKILQFIVDSFLEGRTDRINEQFIGEAVFDRPAGYNPAEDNIVRVNMRHLRERIEEFYRTQGCEEPFILEIPKGKYVPRLTRRSVEQVEPQDGQGNEFLKL